MHTHALRTHIHTQSRSDSVRLLDVFSHTAALHCKKAETEFAFLWFFFLVTSTFASSANNDRKTLTHTCISALAEARISQKPSREELDFAKVQKVCDEFGGQLAARFPPVQQNKTSTGPGRPGRKLLKHWHMHGAEVGQ